MVVVSLSTRRFAWFFTVIGLEMVVFMRDWNVPLAQVPPPKTWVVKWSPTDSNAPMIIHGDFFVSFGCVNAFLQASSLQFGSLWNEIVASYLCCSCAVPSVEQVEFRMLLSKWRRSHNCSLRPERQARCKFDEPKILQFIARFFWVYHTCHTFGLCCLNTFFPSPQWCLRICDCIALTEGDIQEEPINVVQLIVCSHVSSWHVSLVASLQWPSRNCLTVLPNMHDEKSNRVFKYVPTVHRKLPLSCFSGSMHGALSVGGLATTFTASQGRTSAVALQCV